MEKVGQLQRLCNCVYGQIFEGYPGVGGTNGKKVVNFFLYSSTLPMLWPNLNSPYVLWKKLNRVKDCVTVRIVKFLRATHRQGEDGGGRFVNFLMDLNPIYVLVKLELGSYAN